jgi:Mg2+-importing ATPase
MNFNSGQQNKANSNSSKIAFDSISFIAGLEIADVLTKFNTAEKGLKKTEAKKRFLTYGSNQIASEKKQFWLLRLLANLKDPLSLLLLALGIIAYFSGDTRVTVVITVMLFLSVFLRFIQEMRADKPAQK